MKKIPHYLLIVSLGLTLGSCDKFISGYDVNPNAPKDAPSDQQLTAVELSEGFVMSGEMARTAGIWSDYFTGEDRQYEGLQGYIVAAGDFDSMWGNTYQATLTQARLVQGKASAVNNFRLLGIAQVLEAQMVGTATALWGDVPYSEAFVPNAPPKFDPQAQVYVAVQTLLDQAIANLAKTGISPGTRDVFYGGDATKWSRAAHSLKARYYLHMAGGKASSPFYAQAAAEARLGIASSAGDMLMPYNGNATVDANPYWDFHDYNRTGYMDAANAYAAQLLKGTARNNARTNESARYSYFYTGTTAAAADLNTNNGAFAADAKFPLISYVETQAILAEVSARVGTATGQADALASLNNIRTYNGATYTSATAKYSAYTAADFAAGGLLNGGTSALSVQDALIKEVLMEKYLSLIGQIEPFNDIRRTNNVIGVPKKKADAPSLPQRYLYPQSEVNTNPNTPKPLPTLYTKTAVNM